MWKTCYYHAANDCLITVENCIFKTSLPFFKVFYQRLSHRANITATQYHCHRQYHCVSNITAVGSSRHRRIAFARGKNIVSSLLQCIPCSAPRNGTLLCA